MKLLLTDKSARSISSRWVYQLLGLTLAGFLLLLVLDVTVRTLNDELDRQQHHEQSKVMIGELIIRDLSALEAKTYQLLATDGYKSQEWVFGKVEETLENLNRSIDVLEHGGQLRRQTQLNIDQLDEMVRVIDYQPYPSDGFVLEAIELKPKLDQIRQKNLFVLQHMKLLAAAEEANQLDESRKLSEQIKSEMRAFPQLFFRMAENASRLFYVSQGKLDRIHDEISAKSNLYRILQGLLSLVVIVVVILLGKRVLDQINRSNADLKKLATDLEFMKFALDEHAIVSAADVNGRIIYVNQKFCDISGFSEQELLGQTHGVVKSGAHNAAFYRHMWDTISSGKIWHGEIKNQASDGSYYWVAGSIVPFLDSDGKPFQYISIRTDITKRKNMEQTIVEKNNFLQALTDNIGEGIYVLGLDGYCQFMNPEAEHLLGWSLEEVRQHGLHNLVHHQIDEHGHHVGPDECSIFTAIRERRIFRSDEEEFSRKNGEIFPVSLVSMPLFENGVLSGSVTVFHDISQRKQTEFLLADARDKAERANQLKSEFLSNMSHELRTPMNAILGFSELLLLDEELTADQQENIVEIEHAGKHLLELINEILDLSKIESGSISLNMAEVNLGSLIAECLILVDTMSRKQAVKIEVDVAGSLLLQTDYTRLKQVLLNLITNAIKYNREGGQVFIAAAEVGDGKNIGISVRDTGNGIPAEHLQEIFKPFNRLYAEKSNIEGTGIGLTITNRIVQQMGGSIKVASMVNEGSEFTLTLPLHHGAGLDAAPIDTQHKQDNHAILAGKEQKTVVYFEDNKANIRLVERIFRTLPNASIVAFENPVDGLAQLEKIDPDLVLMDISMPEMDGFMVLENIRRIKSLAHVPVIAVTANAMEFDVRRGRQAGFAAYLTKPLDISLFRNTINQQLFSGQLTN